MSADIKRHSSERNLEVHHITYGTTWRREQITFSNPANHMPYQPCMMNWVTQRYISNQKEIKMNNTLAL